MENMKLLIDTNVVLDWILDREPFADYAVRIMESCINGKAKGYLTSHTILNIFYITRKHFDVDARKEIGLMLCEKFDIIGINREFLIKSLQNEAWTDLEDGLQMQCAEAENLDYIITRDSKGFETSKIPILLSKDAMEFIEKY